MARPIAQAPAWMRQTAKQPGRNGKAAPPPPIVRRPVPPEQVKQTQTGTRCKQTAARKLRWKRNPLSVRMVWHVCAFIHWMSQIVGWLAVKAAEWFPKMRSCLLAHAGGRASEATVLARETKCESCGHAYTYNAQRYCRGANNGAGCGCGHWRLARIEHKLGLAAFACPQGEFGYSGLARRFDSVRRRLKGQ